MPNGWRDPPICGSLDSPSLPKGTMRINRPAVALLAGIASLLAVGVAALGATPKKGGWTGTTTVPLVAPSGTINESIDTRFTVSVAKDGSRRVKRFRIGSSTGMKLIDCTPPSAGPYGGPGFASKSTAKVKKGKFKLTYTAGNQSNYKTLKVNGTFTKKTRAKGTLTYTVYKPSASCTTGKVKWKAQRGSGGLPSGGGGK